MPTTPPSDAGQPQTTTAAAARGREQEMRRVAQRQSSELQKDQSTRSRQRGCEGRSSMFATVDLASVPCTSRLSTGRRQSRASEAHRGYAAHPRAGFPSPKCCEAFAMPTHDRLRSDNRYGIKDARKAAVEQNEQRAIDPGQT